MGDIINFINESLLLQVVILVFLGLIFLVMGSFLNVLIYRLPINESLVKKNSHCPKCNHFLKWYENIPLLSYIIQGGKCRGCKEKISIQYPIVEGLSLVMFIISYLRFGLSLQMILFTLLLLVFIVIFTIDIKHYIIPNSMTLTILILGLLNLFVTPTSINGLYSVNFFDKLIGFGVALLIMLLILLLEKAFKKELMGGGDIKLFFGIGLFMGWQLLLLGIFISALIGVIVAFFKKIIKSEKFLNKVIPFGPYLTIGFSFAYLFGLDLINLYLSLFI